MFCPKCSQQQVSDDVRFCSRCGLPLQIVAALLASEGSLQTNQFSIREITPLIRRKGIRAGAKFIFLSVFLAVPGFFLSVLIDHPIPLFLSFIPALIGAAQILYNILFGENIIPFGQKEQLTDSNFGKPLFGMPQTQQVSFPFDRPIITNELKQPMSVTEPTTKLMKNA